MNALSVIYFRKFFKAAKWIDLQGVNRDYSFSFSLVNEELGQPTSGNTEAMVITATILVSADSRSSSTSSLSETSGLPVLPTLTSSREAVANLTSEYPSVCGLYPTSHADVSSHY